MEKIASDVKVVGFSAVSFILDYTQVINSVLTLMISICTFIYVFNRAIQVVKSVWKPMKKKERKFVIGFLIFVVLIAMAFSNPQYIEPVAKAFNSISMWFE